MKTIKRKMKFLYRIDYFVDISKQYKSNKKMNLERIGGKLLQYFGEEQVSWDWLNTIFHKF